MGQARKPIIVKEYHLDIGIVQVYKNYMVAIFNEGVTITVEKAYQLAPQVPNIPDTYAQILLKLGQKREALAKAKEAYELSEGKDIDIALNYVEILALNSRKNSAKKLLNKLQPVTSKQKNKMRALLTSL